MKGDILTIDLKTGGRVALSNTELSKLSANGHKPAVEQGVSRPVKNDESERDALAESP